MSIPSTKLTSVQLCLLCFQLLVRGNYYGHPNHARAFHDNDERQCVWRAASEPSGNGYTAPLLKLGSSTDGIIEFQSDHFNGQMRGNLVVAKYGGAIYRIVLSASGESVLQFSDPAIKLGGDENLDLTQAPDGTIVSARYPANDIWYYKPVEPASSTVTIKSVFPRRGGLAGGQTLSIYGENFNGSPTAKVGNMNCPDVVVVSSKKITCTIPMGTLGTKDVSVTVGGNTDVMVGAFRYITGVPSNPQC